MIRDTLHCRSRACAVWSRNVTCVVQTLYGKCDYAGHVTTASRCTHTNARNESKRAVPRYHHKLSQLTLREEAEEAVRDFLPLLPVVPAGWSLTSGGSTSACFDLHKHILRHGRDEHLHVMSRLPRKQYESTYDEDTGERNEQAYLNFKLFVTKPQRCGGGLELALTSIDMELVVDALTVHATNAQLYAAQNAEHVARHATTAVTSAYNRLTRTQLRRIRDGYYRGPTLNELDDDLMDALVAYLDERGVDHAFAEYMMAQAYYSEQSAYLEWLQQLRRFAE